MGRYQDALDYIFGYVNYEKKTRYPYDAATFDLSRMEQVLDLLGGPHEKFRSVHIAGTKGKGSTSAMVESMLRTAGYRTGLFTSPHLHSFRERIRLGNELMSKAELVALLERCRPAIEAVPGITAFEVMTAMAFQYFAEHNVGWAVVEVGLGGRLDATNVVHPAVCAITSLSYDHVELLGHTLSLIAFEKAGIIKQGVPVVSAPQEEEAMAVIQRVVKDTGAKLTVVGKDWTYERDGFDLSGQTLTIAGPGGKPRFEDLRIPLLGQHQLDNATAAVAIVQQLRDAGVPIGDDAVRQGLMTARWPGRFELLSHSPILVVDSAHNENSAHKLRVALSDYFPRPPRRQLCLVFGASSDKDIAGMLRQFLEPQGVTGYPPANTVIVTKSGHPRSADPAQLADLVRQINSSTPISVQPDLVAALREALAWAEPHDLICITGSIFVVAQARREWAHRHPEAFAADDWVWQDETAGETVPD
jgi:dihydrofolate synthase / folylpolyglutamate synthase